VIFPVSLRGASGDEEEWLEADAYESMAKREEEKRNSQILIEVRNDDHEIDRGMATKEKKRQTE
jgi:hypothetical protein